MLLSFSLATVAPPPHLLPCLCYQDALLTTYPISPTAYPAATPILRAAVPPRRLLSNISTMRQAATQVPRVPPQAQRVGEWGQDPAWM